MKEMAITTSLALFFGAIALAFTENKTLTIIFISWLMMLTSCAGFKLSKGL